MLQIIAYQLLFLVVYDLFLKKETFFNWNRVYLIIAPILSFITPIIKLDIIRQQIPPTYTIQLPAILLTNSPMQVHMLPEVLIASNNISTNYITLIPVLGYVWYIGIGISAFLFIYKLLKIKQLIKNNTKTTINSTHLVSLPNTTITFSFFNIIFIGDKLSDLQKANVLVHERIHVSERHSLDLLFFEILRILLWFNPLTYIYQKRITTLQEYIADAKAIKTTNKKEYYQDLLSQIFQTDRISFVNTFFNHSLIKKRIVMLQKSKSKKIFQLKYLVLIPVITIMLVYSSCTKGTTTQEYMTTESVSQKTSLINKIEAVRHQIEVQGNVNSEERKALKVLSALVSDDISNPQYTDITDNLDIPFGVIEKIPVYPGCENLTQKEAKQCFSKNIAQFVGGEFNTKVGVKENLEGRQKIIVKFKIDKTGKTCKIQAKSNSKTLQEEAVRVVSKLPLMKPGIHDGVAVGVQYSLPIVFDIKGTTNK